MSFRRHFKFLLNFATIVSVRISAVLISFNEEKNIAGALASLAWADEILVVDSGSTDRTREIAEQMGAHVLFREWTGFAAQKQFAADSAENDWVFSLDADERVSPELVESIKSLRTAPACADGYKMSRLAFYCGKPIRHSGWYPDRQLRLFDRRKSRWKDAVIHESIEMAAGAKISHLPGDILHYTVASAAEHHQMIGERYAPLGAIQMLRNGRRTNRLKAAAAGPAAFIKTYFVNLGFLDGFAGFCIAWFAAHHAFMKHLLALELQKAEHSA